MNEAFPAPQIGHIYYYMRIPAELAGHGGFVGDYAEKHGITIEGLEKPVNDIGEKEEAPEEDY